MESLLMEGLKRCYASRTEPVCLYDGDWNCVWNSHDLEGAAHLDSILGLPADWWEGCSRHVILGQDAYVCELLCSKADGIRIAVFRHEEQLTYHGEDITGMIQATTNSCRELYRYMGDNAQDMAPLFNTIMGGCYRIYRIVFFQRELERLRSGNCRRDWFSLNQVMRDVHQHASEILRFCAEIELDVCDEQLWVNGDMDSCICAVLAGLALGWQEERLRYMIRMTLTREGENGVAELHLTALPEERRDIVNLGGFGSTNGERMLLREFCSLHKGKWYLRHEGEDSVFRMELKLSEAEEGCRLLRSPREHLEGRFYNKYEAILARIRFRNYF